MQVSEEDKRQVCASPKVVAGALNKIFESIGDARIRVFNIEVAQLSSSKVHYS